MIPLFFTGLRTLLFGFGKKFFAFLGVALTSVLGNFLIKILLSLGIGFYTFTELNGFFDALLEQYKDAYNSVPATILAFLDLGGFTTGINTALSGIFFLLSYYSTKTAITFLGRALT